MKILQLTSSLAIGGVTSVISNLTHELKKHHEVTIGCYKPYTDEITIDTDGLTIVRYSSIHNFYQDVKAKHYDVIHFHVMLKSGILSAVAHIASPNTTLVAHSHWSQYNKNGLLFRFYETASRFLIRKYIDIKIGCSDLAGSYLFKGESFYTIHNAIDPYRYQFDQDNRNRIRTEYGLSNDDFVIGYIGQFNLVKNIPFLIESVQKAHESNKKIALMLVGGPMNDTVEPLLHRYPWIKWCGLVNDAYRYYSAFDCFALSSLWEGMPMVALEAQANGLNCLLSDTITRLLNIDGRVHYLPLDDDSWVDAILKTVNLNDTARVNHVIGSDFDASIFAMKIEQCYQNALAKRLTTSREAK